MSPLEPSEFLRKVQDVGEIMVVKERLLLKDRLTQSCSSDAHLGLTQSDARLNQAQMCAWMHASKLQLRQASELLFRRTSDLVEILLPWLDCALLPWLGLRDFS